MSFFKWYSKNINSKIDLLLGEKKPKKKLKKFGSSASSKHRINDTIIQLDMSCTWIYDVPSKLKSWCIDQSVP